MLPVHTILFPTDFSENPQQAFPLACSLARDCGARVVVLLGRVILVLLAATFALALSGGFRVDLWGVRLSAQSPWRALLLVVVVGIARHATQEQAHRQIGEADRDGDRDRQRQHQNNESND